MGPSVGWSRGARSDGVHGTKISVVRGSKRGWSRGPRVVWSMGPRGGGPGNLGWPGPRDQECCDLGVQERGELSAMGPRVVCGPWTQEG